MIDDLLEYSGQFRSDWGSRPFAEIAKGKVNAYERLARLGFKAVPDLLRHLDDNRLTRSVMLGFHNFPTWNMKIEHVVSILLEDIAGQEIGRSWHRRQLGYPVTEESARKWWLDASKRGEEAYALRQVWPKQGNNLNRRLVQYLTERYPKHVPKLYCKLLDEHPEMHSDQLAEAVARGPFSRKEKLVLLRGGARRKSLLHRCEALEQLKDLDQKGFVQVLLRTLSSPPTEAPEPYGEPTAANLAGLAFYTDNDQVWKALAG